MKISTSGKQWWICHTFLPKIFLENAAYLNLKQQSSPAVNLAPRDQAKGGGWLTFQPKISHTPQKIFESKGATYLPVFTLLFLPLKRYTTVHYLKLLWPTPGWEEIQYCGIKIFFSLDMSKIQSETETWLQDIKSICHPYILAFIKPTQSSKIHWGVVCFYELSSQRILLNQKHNFLVNLN